MSPVPVIHEPNLRFGEITDKEFLREFLIQRWNTDGLVIMGKKWLAKELNALGAYDGANQLLAVATWFKRGDTFFLGALDSVAEHRGVGGKLLKAVINLAKHHKAKRIRVVVTNENFIGMRFYQRRGFRFTALYVNAAEAYRAVHNEPVAIGSNGIVVRDTLELELIF